MRSLLYFEPVRLLTRARQIGAIQLTRELPFRARRKFASYIETPQARRRLAARGFMLGGKEYPYFVHSYGSTWQTERAVEISLALDFLGSIGPARLLEVGNVTHH